MVNRLEKPEYAYRYDRQPIGLRNWCSKIIADAIAFSAAAARDNSGSSFTGTVRGCRHCHSRLDSLECRHLTGLRSVFIGSTGACSDAHLTVHVMTVTASGKTNETPPTMRKYFDRPKPTV